LVRSIVEIARALEKETVAEFVGDEETLELVRRYGIHYAQGYHLGRPVLELPGAGDPPGA
ncbi:MAG TPA: EAL domain-containing protein, partial [Chromatiales bacterium]|nr:EAL domain-containing protein [Chromatiales bacterium]